MNQLRRLRLRAAPGGHLLLRAVRVLSFLLRALLKQETLLFRPSRVDQGSPRDVGLTYEELLVPAGRNLLRLWWIPGTQADRCVLVLPGALGNMSYELPALLYLHRLGASICSLDYPGYGKSSGHASARASLEAARAAWQHLEARGVVAKHSIFYGRSVGASIAVWLAAHVATPRALVLHSGFTSPVDLVARRMPRWLAQLFCRIPLNVAAWAHQVHCDVRLIHARQDGLVSLTTHRALAGLFEAPSASVAVPGGHFGHSWCHDSALRRMWLDLLRLEADGASGRRHGVQS